MSNTSDSFEVGPVPKVMPFIAIAAEQQIKKPIPTPITERGFQAAIDVGVILAVTAVKIEDHLRSGPHYPIREHFSVQ